MSDNIDVGLNVVLADVESNGSISLWSDEKKKDFCNTFTSRANDTRYILNKTAHFLYNKALDRYFIPGTSSFKNLCFEGEVNLWNIKKQSYSTDRPTNELNKIAESRAKEILKNLPTAKKAVEIVDAETAKKMTRKENINKQLVTLQEQFEQTPDAVCMSDVDQDMTIREFKNQVNDIVKKRNSIINRMNKLGEEGIELEKQIARKLFKGLPGLKEATLKVIRAHVEKSIHFGNVTRRVTEKVMFGDSAEALEILATFESDEIEVSDDVKNEFKDAMKKLVPNKKVTKKRLPSKKSK